MTHDQFKQAVDTLDTGLPQRPDVMAIQAKGRAVRRRRRGVVVASGLAAAAVVAVPLAMTLGGADGTSRVADDASVSPSPTPSASPSPTRTVDPSAFDDQAERMTAVVTGVLPQARRTSDDFYDSYVMREDGMVDIALNDPPDWGSVFRWSQEYQVGDLALFSVSTSWNELTPGIDFCSAGSFKRQSDCSVTALGGGYRLVLHDGVQIEGQADDTWGRHAQLVGPDSDGGLQQQVDVWATESDMTWAEAQQALPSLEDLGAIAQDERMRMPEPLALPEVPQ